LSKVAIEGNALGTGTLTIAAPNTNTNRTLTLPDASGTMVVTGGAQTIEFAAGTAGAPSITTTGDTNTGIFFPAADTIGFAEGGAEAMRIDSSGNLLVGTTTAYGNFTAYKKISMLSSGESSGFRGSYSITNAVAAVNNSTVDGLRFLDPTGTVIGRAGISGIVSVRVRGASGGNQYLANYQILIPGNGTTGAAFTLIGSATTRGTSPVSSVQIANDGDGGGVKVTITYINNAGVVDGGESLIGFCGVLS
jgi:hypothetical protein